MIWALLPITGMVAGLIAGLFGVGGGTIVVPALLFVFAAAGIDSPHLMQVAVGTSLATIVMTSLSSVRAHHAKGAVDFAVLKWMVPGVIAGGLLGGVIADWLSGDSLTVFFVVFLLLSAYQMAFPIKLAASDRPQNKLQRSGAGMAIGTISSMVGIGGGLLTVPYLSFFGTPMRVAVGTAAANGLPIALAGAASFILNGLNQSQLPEYTLGYIFWPGWLLISAFSVLTAPIGAKLAHTLPVPTLKRGFALLLVLVALRLLLTR
ncbi:MAG: sulfite exporter TauE/SafE family protein [Gammaproteobacteria bacterium]|nr:sulfite exporter TauE/SafE family protein [Gammaproteobacteria bacterium]